MSEAAFFVDTKTAFFDPMESAYGYSSADTGSSNELTEVQVNTLVAVNWILVAMFAANLVFMVFNVAVYLVPLGVKSELISLFYILAAIMTIARSIETIYFGLPSDQDSFDHKRINHLVPRIADSVATVANVGIGCLFVATMYQINYAIKMIDDPLIDLDQALKRRVIVYTAAILFTAFFTVAIGLIFILFDDIQKQQEFMYITLCLAYLILPAVYIRVLVQLRKTLVEKTGDLSNNKDTKYVLYQFYFFIASYLTRLVFFIPEIIGIEVNFEDTFVWRLVSTLMYYPWSVLPISFILWMHMRNYSQMKRALDYQNRAEDSNQNFKSSLASNNDMVLCSIVSGSVDSEQN